MNFVEKIRNAMVPDATANGGEPITSNPLPETDVPGAFPDSDDEQEVEKRNQKNLAQGISDTTRRERDPSSAGAQGQGNDNHPTMTTTTTTTLPDRTGTQTEEPRSGQRLDDRGPALSTHSLASHDGALGDEGSHVPADVEQVFEQRKNNESVAEREDEGEAATTRVPSGGAHQQQPDFAVADKETTTRSTSAADEESTSESLGQYSGAGSAGLDKVPSNGGIRNGVLGRGDSHLGPHLGISRPPAPVDTRDNGQIEGVPYGADVESPRDGRRPSSGSSGSKKARAEAVHLSGVSEAGLGLGGVHNGVVGHGSHNEEDTRHSTSHKAVQPVSTTV